MWIWPGDRLAQWKCGYTKDEAERARQGGVGVTILLQSREVVLTTGGMGCVRVWV